MNLTMILIGGGVLAVLLLIIGIAVSVASERSVVEERLDRYVDDSEPEREQAPQKQESFLTEWLNQRVQRSSWGEKVSKDLARADLKMKVGEYVTLLILSAIGFGLVLWFVSGRNIFIGILGVIGGAFVPGIYVNSQQGRRLQKFNDQLGDMLNLMVNGLRAGYSTMQAMEAVSKELPPPINDEFRRVVQEMQLGIPMEQALDNLLRRIPSEDLDLVITAINVQREVGGNLTEILDTISYTIRERVRIKGEIRVLTTQVMYSGRFLSLMPLGVIGALYIVNPKYMGEYFDPKNNRPIPCGYIALVVAAALIVGGYFAMNKLGDIEV